MTVLAIDPGNIQSAFVVWDGCQILSKGIVPNDELLSKEWWADQAQIDDCAIEMIASYGMAVGKEVFETCLWVGRYLERWSDAAGKPATLIYRKEVKIHHCHSMKAKDSNIRQAVVDRLGAPGTKKNPGVTYGVSKDIWAALAIGLYWTDTHQVCEVAA